MNKLFEIIFLVIHYKIRVKSENDVSKGIYSFTVLDSVVYHDGIAILIKNKNSNTILRIVLVFLNGINKI